MRLFVLAVVLWLFLIFLESIVVVRTEYRTKAGDDPRENFAEAVFAAAGLCAESGTMLVGADGFDVTWRAGVVECSAAKLCTFCLIVVKLSLIDRTVSISLDVSSFDAGDLENAAVFDDDDGNVALSIFVSEENRRG